MGLPEEILILLQNLACAGSGIPAEESINFWIALHWSHCRERVHGKTCSAVVHLGVSSIRMSFEAPTDKPCSLLILDHTFALVEVIR